ncbi:hypothetical protein [Streptomyces sp. NPDC014734]|uniref:hypothetical protein n=1 Tax=Streptomyces sp. NPDC014734 TaxID=3364886 RepID=UPI0036F8ACCE
MTPRHLLFLLLAAVVAGVLGVGSALGWPIWIWFLLAALVAGVLLLGMLLPRTGEPFAPARLEPDATMPLPPVEPPYLVTDVMSVSVESAKADYPFLFSAVIRWRTTSAFGPASHGNPSSLAVAAVLNRVRDSVAAEHPNRCGYLQHWLEGVLGSPVTDESGLVSAFATDIRLTLSRSDQQHLDELEELRKSASTWQSRREYECDRRAYLGDDVLRSPGSAVVWWMARHEDEIDRAVEMIAPLTCLSAAANDKEIPEEFRHLITALESPEDGSSAGGFEHPEPLADYTEPVAARADGTSDASRTRRRSKPSDHVAALVDELGLEKDVRAAFIQRLASTSAAAGRSDAADGIRQDLLHVAGDGPGTGAYEVPSEPVLPTTGPVGPSRAEDFPAPRANGQAGTGRPESADADWRYGGGERTAPGAEPPAPPVSGSGGGDRNAFDEGRGEDGTWQ